MIAALPNKVDSSDISQFDLEMALSKTLWDPFDISTMATPMRLPTVYECATYIQLLEAIVAIKKEVGSWEKSNNLESGKGWELYCRLAVERFRHWSQSVDLTNDMTPSLDVLMVWQTYMLNTAYYRYYDKSVLDGRLEGRGINWVALVSTFELIYQTKY
jgi:hypothetical protein